MSQIADVVELNEERSKRAPLTDSEFAHTGAMFKAAREALGYSVADVHDGTNIREDYIEAIEEMAFDRLPLAAYTTGFVKSYAQFLELPVTSLVERFRAEAGYETSIIAPEVPEATRSDIAGGRELSLIAVLLIIGFVVWVAYQITKPSEDAGPVLVEGTPLQERPIEQEAPDSAVGNLNPENILAQNTTVEAQNNSPDNSSVPSAETNLSDQKQEAIQRNMNLENSTEGEGDVSALEVSSESGLVSAIEAEASTQENEITSLEGAEQEAINPEAIEQPIEVNEEELAGLTDAINDLLADDEAPEVVSQATTEEANSPNETLSSQEIALVEPKRTRTVLPIYPSRCQRFAEEIETVTVVFDVDERGRPRNQRVTETSNRCFNSAALNAVARWRFDAGTRNGSPITSFGRTTQITFNLPE